jgi:hypothetical protein
VVDPEREVAEMDMALDMASVVITLIAFGFLVKLLGESSSDAVALLGGAVTFSVVAWAACRFFLRVLPGLLR